MLRTRFDACDLELLALSPQTMEIYTPLTLEGSQISLPLKSLQPLGGNSQGFNLAQSQAFFLFFVLKINMF
jgi:hypothetical protein